MVEDAPLRELSDRLSGNKERGWVDGLMDW